MSCNPLLAATIALLAFVPASALAVPTPRGEPSLGLRWSDPKLLSPTTEQDFDTQLTERLGRRALLIGRHEPALSITWDGLPERCRVELSLTGAEGFGGTRVIQRPSGDCRSLIPALLTVAALLVESYEATPVSDVAAPKPVLPAPAASVPPPPASITAPRASSARALLSVGGALSSGFVPKLEVGLAAAAAWAPVRHARIGLVGAFFIGHDYGNGPGLLLDHRRAALFLCGMPLSGSVAVGLCGNLGLHHFDASGTSLPRPESTSLTTWSIGAELRAEWRLTRRLWWLGQVGGDIPTQPLYFYYTTAGGGTQNLFEQRRVNPSLLIALSLEVL